jgi:hypothetical protein
MSSFHESQRPVPFHLISLCHVGWVNGVFPFRSEATALSACHLRFGSGGEVVAMGEMPCLQRRRSLLDRCRRESSFASRGDHRRRERTSGDPDGDEESRGSQPSSTYVEEIDDSPAWKACAPPVRWVILWTSPSVAMFSDFLLCSSLRDGFCWVISL